MNDYIPIANVELSDDEIEAAVGVLESGYLRQGPKTEEFEKKFADKVGADHAVAVSSGTAALHMAYLALLDEGGDVLVPSFSHISTASMVAFSGGRPVFCDLDPRTFTLDPESAEERITEDTTTIVPVHLFGNAADVDALRDLAEDRDLTVIWDAAQAHGTEYRGRDVGSFDDAVCYSFYPTKNMTTGEGGMITTNDGELAEELRLLREHGQTEKYYHPKLGLNYRMTDVEAAVGIKQLEKLDDFVDRRRENADYLMEKLSEVDGVIPPRVEEGAKHSYHQYTILLDPEELECTRDEFIEDLDDRGIGAAVHYPRPLHKQPIFQDLYGDVTLPVSEDIAERILSLPVYPSLEKGDLEKVVDAVAEVAAENYSK
ncbi:aminotransferase DegT [candidate division MSBL1 archaeon SCGC-AAA259A05]|uniref:Aminotransferase DegT n=1 Tax=candidate division MSBL1 archaeon SCGC-AAA259A05 TaxID=1698259 RepID=A0A133UB73_9EURY|nr:aminotransferase DegT [candidate division MSBL1 archaeon SCGC-AAA259A05]